MATEHVEPGLRIVSVDRKDAADLIGLLAAQLAGTALTGNMSGALPSINVVENGVVKYRLVLVLGPEKSIYDVCEPPPAPPTEEGSFYDV